MVHLNITLPEDVVKELKTIKNKSRFIAEVVREKFRAQKKTRLEIELAEGYREMAKQNERVARDWDSTAADSWE